MAEANIVTGGGGPGGQPQVIGPDPQGAGSQGPGQQGPQAPNPQPQAAPERGATITDDGIISWTASEFISHEKSTGWYGKLALGAVILAAIIYFLTKDIISTSVVIICAIAFGAIAGRRPRQLRYQISNAGVTIGQKQLTYAGFKSFSVIPEGAFSSIVFKPLKRFAPLTTIYYSPNDEDQILNLLSQHLPFEEYKPDPVDNMMRRIRF
ncbi:MAG TPA: hypothetical protein VHA05_03735 [Candidatus Saccharimonadales bacterium]|jgi:hypothetical protein|nr:hypothetical protein [Candidatus Saccharimonadales bacterium]